MRGRIVTTSGLFQFEGVERVRLLRLISTARKTTGEKLTLPHPHPEAAAPPSEPGPSGDLSKLPPPLQLMPRAA